MISLIFVSHKLNAAAKLQGLGTKYVYIKSIKNLNSLQYIILNM
jgi:hypothetical protein